MALFKVYRGNEANLPSQMNDGWAYFCTDTCNFYIDWADDDQVVSRSQINAKSAETIRYMADGEYIELDVSAIAAFLNTDTTLSISGKAADAAAVGEVVADIRTEIDSKFSEKSNLYVQPDEPENASDGAIWVDTDESIAEGVIVPDGGNGNSSAVSVGDVTINLEDSNIGEANLVNADLLDNIPASEYLKRSEITIPSVTEDDNGKILRVVDGAPSWQTIMNAREASF